MEKPFAVASPTVPNKHSTLRRRGSRSEQTFHERRRHPSLSLPAATTLSIGREELGDGMGTIFHSNRTGQLTDFRLIQSNRLVQFGFQNNGLYPIWRPRTCIIWLGLTVSGSGLMSLSLAHLLSGGILRPTPSICPLVSALLDVAYQLGLPIDGEPVNGCLTEFENLMEHDASDETVRIYARAYILMLLSSQLFTDKNANRVHLRWLPYLASLDDLGRYSWGSAALAWLYGCFYRGTNRNVVNLAGPLQLLQSWIFWRFPTLRPSGFDGFGFPLASMWATYMPRNDAGDQRLLSARLSLDRLRVHDFVWEPYSSAEVATVIHSEILADEHRRLWTAITSLIYFAAIEWHQVDRVLSQFGGVQHLPQPALNIDWLHAKDGRGGDRWFPTYYREWHQHWENRLHSVIWVESLIPDPRPIVLTEEARYRGSSQAPPRVHVYDRPDNRRVDRRRRIGTRTTDREWRELADRLEEDIPRADHGDAVDYRVPRRRGRRQAGRDGHGGARGRGPSVEDEGTQHGVVYHPAVGMDIDDPVTESEFYRDIADMSGMMMGPIIASPADPWFALGGTPASTFSAVFAQPSAPAADERPRRVRRPPLCGTGGHLLGQFDDDDSDTIEDSD
ncbi:uncharacterized protein DS421_2g43900 [Arachis hypogaea]|nr:uncharacterized protein DS421_2g43900 [Arachis hypogaea]